MLKIYLLISCFTVLVKGTELPSYIKKCKLSDPNINKCVTEHANEAIPTIVKGDPNFKIIYMSPIVIPTVDLGSGPNLEVRLDDVTTDNLKEIKIQDSSFDTKSKKLFLDVTLEVLQILAKYVMKGQILVLPITGEGATNMTFVNNRIKYDAEFDVKKVGGEEFYTIRKTQLEFEPKRVYFYFENLFGGDPTLGKQMNDFLNENWKEFFTELKPAIKKTMEAVVTNAIKAYFSKVPISNLFDD